MMHKSFALKMMAVALLVVFVAGCQTGIGGPKDKKAVDKMLADWKAALEKQDIDAMMAFYSEDFTTDRGNTKAEVGELFQGFKDQGYLEGAAADLSAAKVEFDKEKGTAYVAPITLSSDAGSLGATLTLKKEGNAWRIIASEMEQ